LKILISPDKFKGSLTSVEVADAIEEGIRLIYPHAEIIKFPLADGGDGTASLLTRHFRGRFIKINVHDPLFNEITAEYGFADNIKTAFIEMSSASGLRLIDEKYYNPLLTTTLGTGEMIMDSIKTGAKKIILGIGGSATTDAGIGMASALGYKFLDINGEELKPAGESLQLIRSIEDPKKLFKPSEITVHIACDVDNPLYGKRGAAYVYGPQKGATSDMVIELDKGLRNFASIVSKKFGKDISRLPGAGAAGGLGAGAVAFLDAIIRPGIDLYMEITGFEKQLKGTDLIITGEGKLDRQTFHGKVIDGVTRLAGKHKIPILAICGDIKSDSRELKKHGILRSGSLVDHFGSVDKAIKNASTGVAEISKNLIEDYLRTVNTSNK
jgi:glycerate kinase